MVSHPPVNDSTFQLFKDMFSKISNWILKLWGWKIEGEYPHHIPKMVVMVIPHTSNWDFPVGLLLRSAIKADIKYVGKATLFRPPFGWIFRALGGYPVDRTKSSNYVDAVVDIFNREDSFALTIAPEGKRQRVERLKTGFYFIAVGANVPIARVKFDWGKKVLGFAEPFYPTGDYEKDLPEILRYFADAKGYHPAWGFQYEAE